MLTEELDVPVNTADPVTLKRLDLAKGVVPDNLYYLGENAAKVRAIRDLDLAVYPPPDLIIEVDLTSSSVPRQAVFAKLGIAEVWRAEADDDLLFLHLQPEGTYQPRDRSLAPIAEAARSLDQGRGSDKTPWIKAFRAYADAEPRTLKHLDSSIAGLSWSPLLRTLRDGPRSGKIARFGKIVC